MSRWEKVRLGDVATYINGFAFKPSDWKKEGLPIVRIQNLNNEDAEFNYTDRVVDRKYLIDDGDVLISWSASLGVYIWNRGKALLNQHIFKVVFDKCEVDKIYFTFAIMRILDVIARKTHGSTMKHITKTNFDSTLIPLPPIDIQTQVARKLSLVSELLSLHKSQLMQMDHLINSVFYEMFGDPTRNEHGWEKKSISEICIINPNKSELGKINDHTLVSFIPMNSVSETGAIDSGQTREYHEVKTGYTYFRENDVLFAKITPCMENGKGAVARNLCNGIGFGSTEFHVLRPIGHLTDSEWLYRLTSLPDFRINAEKNMTGSAGQKRVPTSFFDKFSVGLPPLALQQKYAKIVKQIETQKSLIKQSIDETQRLFNSLMSKYFDD